MKKLLLFVFIGGFIFWVYKVPLEGRLPKLTGVKSGIIMNISSNSFTNSGTIPDKYTCVGENVNPQLEFSGVPTDAKSLVVVMDDPDAPNGTFTHWIVFNIKPSTKSIPEAVGIVPGVQAKNSAGLKQYTGPCPPSGVHRYYFKLYALDTMLSADEIVTKTHLQEAIAGHILDTTELMGKYSKPQQ